MKTCHLAQPLGLFSSRSILEMQEHVERAVARANPMKEERCSNRQILDSHEGVKRQPYPRDWETCQPSSTSWGRHDLRDVSSYSALTPIELSVMRLTLFLSTRSKIVFSNTFLLRNFSISAGRSQTLNENPVRSLSSGIREHLSRQLD